MQIHKVIQKGSGSSELGKTIMMHSIRYRGWIGYKSVIAATNLKSPKKQIRNAIEILTNQIGKDCNFLLINEVTLKPKINSPKLHRYILTYKDCVIHKNDKPVSSGLNLIK